MRVFANNRFKPVTSMVACMVAIVSLLSVATNVSFAETSDKHRLHISKKEKAVTSDPIVVMETNKGTIKIQIFKNDAPITSNNFLDLVQRNFYNGLTFHRYEPGFVIQGGDPNGNGSGGFIDPQTHQERRIPLEKIPTLKHNSAGVIAMARTQDPNTASSQFYFTLAPASFLDDPPGYAVFGKVVDGMAVVQQLRKGDKMTKVSITESGK